MIGYPFPLHDVSEGILNMMEYLTFCSASAIWLWRNHLKKIIELKNRSKGNSSLIKNLFK